MFNIFNKPRERINIEGDTIFINNEAENIGRPVEVNRIFQFNNAVPQITIFEDNILSRQFKVETLIENPNLDNQFLHSSIRILPNSAVMIDGIISNNSKSFPEWTESDYEAIRLQPFYLSDKDECNKQLIGKGLFERGLHFSGTITPSTVRNICICDSCNQSFTIQHFHAGFSDAQYFYSSDSKETLTVPYSMMENISAQLQKDITETDIESVDARLPKPTNNQGLFKYYNSFRCPHCLHSFIDFEKHREIRSGEYYGNTYINKKPLYFNSVASS